MLKRNIAASSLKILWKNLHSVKCYDISNMNVFTLSLCLWGLIYFDQFISVHRAYLWIIFTFSSPELNFKGKLRTIVQDFVNNIHSASIVRRLLTFFFK